MKGRGTGGRNMEFVLAALAEMRREGLGGVFCGTCAVPEQGEGQAGSRPFDWLIMSLGTDGVDGPTDAAGAWADGTTLERARELGLDLDTALTENDSYPFFAKTGNSSSTRPGRTSATSASFSSGRAETLEAGQACLRVRDLRQTGVGVLPEVEEFAVVLARPRFIPLLLCDLP